MEVLINGKLQFVFNDATGEKLKYFIEKKLALKPEEYYLLSHGKQVNECDDLHCSRIHIIPRVLGGKGGFGSMLRAIGAQIEKTTNREACRDLSGRRLRDINEEQRLKSWINQQAEREKEAKERKQKKLERLCETPKHEFKDEQYDKERSELPEIVEDAVIQGIQASCSTKRKATDKKTIIKKKKAKLWVDDEFDDDLSSSEVEDQEDDSEDNKHSEVQKVSDSDSSSGLERTSETNESTTNNVQTKNNNADQSNNSKPIDIQENDSFKDDDKSLENHLSEISGGKEETEENKNKAQIEKDSTNSGKSDDVAENNETKEEIGDKNMKNEKEQSIEQS